MADNLSVTNNMSKKWSQNIPFPLDNYIVRCTDEEFGRSSKDNPMITLKFEIDRPEEVDIGGEMYNVAGARTVPMWIPTQVYEEGELNAEKSANAKERLAELYRQFGMAGTEVNPENPVLGFKGRLVHVRAHGRKEEQRKAPTPEQKKRGEQGDLLKNPITGEPSIRYSIAISEIFGPAEGDTNKPY